MLCMWSRKLFRLKFMLKGGSLSSTPNPHHRLSSSTWQLGSPSRILLPSPVWFLRQRSTSLILIFLSPEWLPAKLNSRLLFERNSPDVDRLCLLILSNDSFPILFDSANLKLFYVFSKQSIFLLLRTFIFCFNRTEIFILTVLIKLFGLWI